MKSKSNSTEALRAKIEQLLTKQHAEGAFKDRSLEELVQDINIYHQELEFQNEELRRIQQELELSRRHFYELFEKAPVGYVVYDQELIIRSANEAFLIMCGSTADIVINRSITRFIHADSQDVFYFHKNKLWKEKEPATCEIRLQRKNGEMTVKAESNIFFKDSQILIRTAFIDLSSEKALLKQEQEYRSLFENITQGFALHEIITDKQGNPVDYRFLKVNPAFEKLTGTRADDILGKTVKEVLPGTEEMWIREYGEVALTGAEKQFESFSKELNSYFEVRAFCPQHGHFAVVFTDVTDRVMAMRAMEKAKDQAERSDNLKTLFLNNLSHEIRTPLNSIVGFSEFLNEENLDREQISHLTGIITQSSGQLLNIIDEIVSISTIEAGLAEVYITEVSIEHVVRHVFQHQQADAVRKGIRFRANNMLLDHQDMILSDEGKLAQVLMQLTGNAIKFTERGYVEFGVSLKDHTLLFYVADTGIGIPELFRDKVFERFEQVETEQSKIRGGLGLGLPIARAHVSLLGGEIWYESEEGKGTTFFFTIPWKSTQKEVEQESGKRLLGPQEKRTVLVAEDEENNFELTKVILSTHNFDILHAWNGRQAVDMVRENPNIDLVLMDIKMPVMNGTEATREIKSFMPKLPVIALTAYALPGDREKVLASGCDDYIAKPISLQEFLDKVKRFL